MTRAVRPSTLLLVLFSCSCVTACAGPPRPPTNATTHARSSRPVERGELHADDRSTVTRAVELMDTGDLPASIALLEQLHSRLSNHEVVLHELALAYRRSHAPQRAVTLLSPYEHSLGANLLASFGSALDEAGDPEKAETVLRTGLGRFPASGLLCSELGTTLASHGRVTEAVELYERGMAVEPTWPSNYLRAAELFAPTDYPVMTLVWGETFRLLEPNSERSAELAERMVDVFGRRITRDPERPGSTSVRLAAGPGILLVDPSDRAVQTLDFAHAYELRMAASVAADFEPTLAGIHATRARFFAEGSATHAQASPKVELLEWVSALAAAGHLEAYDYWLFAPGWPEEFAAWVATHEREFDAMVAYVDAHVFTPTHSVDPDDRVPAHRGGTPVAAVRSAP